MVQGRCIAFGTNAALDLPYTIS